MLTIKNGYALYIEFIKTKLDKYTNKLEDITEQKEYLSAIISANEMVYKKAGIDIDELTYSNRRKFDIRLIKKHHFASNIELLMQSYIVSYINLLKLEQVCLNAIKQYSMLSIPYEYYRYIFVELNMEYIKAVLKGKQMNLGSGIGSIFVKEKERSLDSKNIDWKSSNTLKQSIIDEGKIPYDKNNAPDGVKWHIYFTSTFTYWIWWKYSTLISTNATFYKFIPTKFINGKARNSKDFKKDFDTVDKILDSNELGSIDKLYRILELDPSHALNYKQY